MKEKIKKQRRTIGILVLVAVITIAITYIVISKEKQMIINNKSNAEKMTDSSRITELEKQIDKLNAEHAKYAGYVQEGKEKIATAITNNGVETSADATADTMANNIENIRNALGTGASIDFLWQNPNPAAKEGFPETIINIGTDINNYQYLMVFGNYYYGNTTKGSLFVEGPKFDYNTNTGLPKIENGTATFGGLYDFSTRQTQIRTLTRVSDTEVKISLSDKGGAIYCIPTYIYGVKTNEDLSSR